jgi:hypothetical protein
MVESNWNTCKPIITASTRTIPYHMDILCLAFQGTIALNPVGTWDATRKKELSCECHEKIVNCKSPMSKSDKNPQTLEAALAASCQIILTEQQSILITPPLSRYSLLLGIKAKLLAPEYANEMRPFVDLNAVLSVSPCAWTLHNWASELATAQAMWCPRQI